MKATTFAAVSLMASVAVAQPHRHQHMDHHHKRADPPVVWVTEFVSTTTTVDITTTIWVSEGFVVPTSQVVPTTQSAVTSSSIEQQPAQFFEPASSRVAESSSSVVVVPTTSTSTTPVAVVVAPTVPVVNTPVISAAPVQSTSTSSPVAVFVPQTTLIPVVVPSSTSAAVAATTTQVKSSGSSTKYTGDMTYYDISADEYGSCGVGADGTKENIVALSKDLLGPVSNGNPMCGMTITIKNPANGKTTTAKVIDKCPGCTINSIDLSRAAFAEIADFSVGRTTCEWWFN